METAQESALRDLGQHLTSDRQAWLLGAGVSYGAGIPLMSGLTAYVKRLLEEECSEEIDLFSALCGQLPEDHHIEHVLSQIGDFVAIAERSKDKEVVVGSLTVTNENLRTLHNKILERIGKAVRYGFTAASGATSEVCGTSEKPIVSVDNHRAFIKRLFEARTKPGVKQAPISFFTINYDTLVEDALALEGIPYVDGFVGGAMAYWAPEIGFLEAVGKGNRAKVVKLHGSVDWYRTVDGRIVRCRNSCAYPKEKEGTLLIYPQSTKYVATQKDPFAGLFSKFRECVGTGPDNVLGICGYSFGDEHVDGEIEAAMSLPQSKTVIVAFVSEIKVGDKFVLPIRIQEWLTARPWKERVFVASSRGLYHGSMHNLIEDKPQDWWTFEGLTRYFSESPEITLVEPPKPNRKLMKEVFDTEVEGTPTENEEPSGNTSSSESARASA